MAERVYAKKSQEGESGAGGSSTSQTAEESTSGEQTKADESKKKGNVVDAEFEEVKDK